MSPTGRARSEREQLELFHAIAGDFAPRDAQDLMAFPFFSLAKSPRMVPIDYRTPDVTIRVEASAEHGMATIWDADVLIWAASHLVAARDAGRRTSRLMVASPREILIFIGRGDSARDYERLEAAFLRWAANDYGTVVSCIDIVRVTRPGEPYQTVPFVRPGGESLLRQSGWPKVRLVLEAIDRIEEAAIDPVDVAPEHWRHLHNRVLAGQAPRPYRVHLGDADAGPEIGAGWKRTGEKAGTYLSLVLDDPMLAQPIRANLFQSDRQGRAFHLVWSRPVKRDDRR